MHNCQDFKIEYPTSNCCCEECHNGRFPYFSLVIVEGEEFKLCCSKISWGLTNLRDFYVSEEELRKLSHIARSSSLL